MEHRIVIVGAGFAGIEAAKALARTSAKITIIDRTNHHLFQPLLYQVATAGLSPGDIAVPIRGLFRNQPNVNVLWAEVRGVDRAKKEVETSIGPVPYDDLILATGSEYNYFGNDGWKKVAPKLKTLPDATQIREKLLTCFELAEETSSEKEREKLLTFLFIGAGPTGVELAGALAELARHCLARDYRRISEAKVRIVLVEAVDQILGAFPKKLAERAQKDLEKLGVEVHLNTKVEAIRPGLVTTNQGEFPAATVVWTAGVRATPVAEWVGAPSDKGGRVLVAPELCLKDDPHVFVVGDACGITDKDGNPLPAIAPAAIQQGRYVGRLLKDRLKNRGKSKPFRYFDKGMLATIGRSKAVALVGPLKISGFPAWFIWVFVHLMYLVGFENRLLVFVQWCWYYFAFKRSVRLITANAAPSRVDGDDNAQNQSAPS